MPGRFPSFVILLAFAAGGCATVSEERISMLESAVIDLQAREYRLASLEETVAALAAKHAPPESRPAADKAEDLQTRPGPRRVSANPAPAPTKPVPPEQPATPRPVPAQAATAQPRPVADVPARPVSSTAPQPVPATPSSQAAAPSASRPAPVKRANPAQAQQRYRAALAALESGRPQTALGQFRDFLAEYPGHELAPNAGYWLGECHYSMKHYDSAIIAFKDVVAQYPAHDKAAASMLKAGFSYALLGDSANARFYLETLIRDFPTSQPASLARARLAAL